jgi:DNA polymerase III alpha subunit
MTALVVGYGDILPRTHCSRVVAIITGVWGIILGVGLFTAFSKMLTVSTLSGKALIKDAGKIIGEKDETEMNKITSLFTSKYGKVAELEEMYESSEEFKDWCDENKLIYNTALKLKDLIRNKGVHASGIVVSYDDLNSTTPTELTADKEQVCP